MKEFPQPPVTLAKSGTKLPLLDSLILRYLVGPIAPKLSTWEGNLARFEKEGEKILSLLGESSAILNVPVLVPKLRGIEDSSRFWSIAMTLDHLMIVGKAIGQTSILLSEEKKPTQKADLAAVKPIPAERKLEIVEEFSLFSRSWGQKILREIKNRNSKSTHFHPWFGEIDANQWFWLLGVHQGIHRKQIEEIIRVQKLDQ